RPAAARSRWPGGSRFLLSGGCRDRPGEDGDGHADGAPRDPPVARHQGERGEVAGEGGPPDPPPPGRLLGLEGPVVEPGGGGDLLAAAGAHRPETPWAGDDLAG